MDYGQFAISSKRKILYSGATAQSTMDFSSKPIEDGVVNSPPRGGSRITAVLSPSPLRSVPTPSEPSSHGYNPSQRKLYKDDNYPMDEHRVYISYLDFYFFYYMDTCPIPFFGMFVNIHVSFGWFLQVRRELSGSTHSAPNPQTKRLPVVKLVA